MSPNPWAPSAWPRANLDNLVFVINCNLQRLDGPVRGNGKIVQELEGSSAAGLERHQAALGQRLGRAAAPRQERQAQQLMMETLDGDYQAFQGQRRRLSFARTSLAATPRHSSSSSICPTKKCSSCAAAATSPPRCTRLSMPPTRTRASPPCCWSRPSRATAWARPVKGQEHRAPDQEAVGRGHQVHPRPLQYPDSRQRAAGLPFLQVYRRHARNALFA